jgi:hypothetical protein
MYGIAGLRPARRVSGVGNLRTGQPPRPVQTFRVASQTKAFVATIVLQLVAEGHVGLDAPVSRYLPPRLLPDGDRITVRQLLNHTSGLYDPQVELYQTLQDIHDLGLGGAGVQRRRPGRVLRRPVRRPPAASAAAGRDADPTDTGAPGSGYGLGLEIYTLPCGAVVAGHTGALPGYNSGWFRLLGDDKDARVVANLHPAPDSLYLALSAALVELFCGMTPAEAGAAARANPATAGVIRFR